MSKTTNQRDVVLHRGPWSEEDPVAKPNEAWFKMAEDWVITDSLNEGTKALRRHHPLFLPQEPKEPDEAYFVRIRRSVLTNYYRDTVNKLVGKPLQKPVVLGQDVPEVISIYADDMDNCGTDINVFSKQLLTSALNHGLTHILVDYPKTGGALSLAQERLQGIRPYCIHYEAPDVVGWKSEVIDGAWNLTQLRVYEVSYEDAAGNEFAQERVERIRVFSLEQVAVDGEQVEDGAERHVLVRSWRKVYKDDTQKEHTWEEEVERRAVMSIDYIPLVTIYTDREKFMVAKPPMMDLANLNIAHFQSDSDQRNILHVARVPILFATGFGDEEKSMTIAVGPNTMTKAPKGADLKYVEHGGGSIEAGRNDLADLEQRMATLGFNMLVKKTPGNVTATGRAMDQAEADSPLGMLASELEQALNSIFDLFAYWDSDGKQTDAGGSVTVYKDFSISARDSEDIKALIDLRTGGDLSRVSLYEELMRRNVLRDDFDPAREAALLEIESSLVEGPAVDDLDTINRPGDETEAAAGHSHILQSDGYTNIVDGHRHEWRPEDSATSEVDGHRHDMRGGLVEPEPASGDDEAELQARAEDPGA